MAIHSRSKGIRYRCYGTAEYLRTKHGERGSLIFDGAGDECDVVPFINNSKEISKWIYDLALLNINNRLEQKLNKEKFFANTYVKKEIGQKKQPCSFLAWRLFLSI